MKKRIEEHPMFHADKLTSEQQLYVLKRLILGDIGGAREYLDNLNRSLSPLKPSPKNANKRSPRSK